MDVLARMRTCGIVPVVVLEDADDAVATAKAMLKGGGVDLMEITFRTAAAPESIRRVAAEVPDMVVGAGTVVTLDQCQQAVECGAKFIVSPGYDEEVAISPWGTRWAPAASCGPCGPCPCSRALPGPSNAAAPGPGSST